MKKNFKKSLVAKMLLLALSVMFVLSGCGGQAPAEPEKPAQSGETPQTQETVSAEIQAFFDSYVNTNERPVAIMIDNDDKNARPHAGLNEAYLIYEMVVEGGATRFMALLRGVDTEKLGPVRSSRHYFLDYALEHDAIYTHFGWSPRAESDIPALGVNNINGVTGSDAGIYWREEKYKGDWHSAYTSIKKIRDHAAKKGYKTETQDTGSVKFADHYIELTSGKTANTVSLPYSGRYRTGYTYNATTELYEKSIDGAPHAMQNGEVLAVKNIIVQFVGDTDLGDGSARRNITTTGSGKGYYITGGAYEEITWSKPSRSGDTIYKRADGSELLISPGKTIINLFNPASGIVIE